MKLLLTSLGLTNDSIRKALVDLLGKPIEVSKAVFIPTAMYAMPGASGLVWEVLKEQGEVGWQELGVLELTALPSILQEHWLPALEAADVIIVGGGNTPYLSYWMQASGLDKKLPELLKNTVYMGVSAGSMVMAHSIHINREELETTGIYYDDEYHDIAPANAGSDKTLKLVDFTLRPHLGADYFPNITLDRMQKAAVNIDVPMYVIDDQTALKVTDSNVEVVSEGQWKLFEK
ncbi:MAG: Type 1 glutamine amidotransferase-like domain-containing protein [Ktedonobacteraceae bacterium]|nr:Type 1 glutamine amidotransferase-like domain-containing protein [Ktedonobacteraceae bacterium]